jgi:salicylate hydroxylase
VLIYAQDYLPQIREALSRVPSGGWREFAAFAGPEMDTLTAWDNKIALVGDSSHALSGAFGSGAGFAMEDGWILAQCLEFFGNDLNKALPLFDQIRLSYYARMYTHLAFEVARRAKNLEVIGNPSFDEKVANKIISDGGVDMSWIYDNDIERVWNCAVQELGYEP